VELSGDRAPRLPNQIARKANAKATFGDEYRKDKPRWFAAGCCAA
jgi:hypothetical protein